MALPPSGNSISISQIRTELGTSNGSLRALSALAGFSTPDSMSEFYGYVKSTAWGGVKLGTTSTNTCSATATTVYSTSSTWTTGMGFWYDSARTNPVTGFNYIVLPTPYTDADKIYNLTSSTLFSWLSLGSYTGTNCGGSEAILYYTYEAYSGGYEEASVYYNGGSVTMTSNGSSDGPIFLSPSSQTISADAYESNGFGATINYELNDVFQAYYSEPYIVSTPNISTSSGNTYYFGIVTGAF